MPTIQNLKQLIKEADYEVRVYLTEDGCTAKFPERLEHPSLGQLQIDYRIEDIQKNVSNHLVRPIIMVDISKHALIRGISPALISFLAEDVELDEEDFLQLINIELTQEEEEKETILYDLIIQCCTHGFRNDFIELAHKYNLGSEIKLVKSIIENYIGETNE